MLTHHIQEMVWIVWSMGWSVSGYYAPDWFTGPAIADLFCEIDSMENLQSDLSDATTELNDVDDPSPELLWSDDSDSETEIWGRQTRRFYSYECMANFWRLGCPEVHILGHQAADQ